MVSTRPGPRLRPRDEGFHVRAGRARLRGASIEPALAAGVWVGYDDKRKTLGPHEEGSRGLHGQPRGRYRAATGRTSTAQGCALNEPTIGLSLNCPFSRCELSRSRPNQISAKCR
jgi:hypothetical protein